MSDDKNFTTIYNNNRENASVKLEFYDTSDKRVGGIWSIKGNGYINVNHDTMYMVEISTQNYGTHNENIIWKGYIPFPSSDIYILSDSPKPKVYAGDTEYVNLLEDEKKSNTYTWLIYAFIIIVIIFIFYKILSIKK